MALKTEFQDKLDDLWTRRIERLESLVGISYLGHPMRLTKHVRDKRIDELLNLATEMLRKKAKKELKKVTGKLRKRHISGYGIQNRFERLWSWVQNYINGPIVYSFWKGGKCLYVGKGKSIKRIVNYRRSAYLLEADVLKIHTLQKKSLLPQVECLAIHLYKPRDNYNKPARVRWGKACHICEVHDEIKTDLKSLFAIKK